MRRVPFWLAMTIGLAACSHGSPDAPTQSASAPTPTPAPAPPRTVSATITAAERPFEQYLKPDHDGLQWAALYYAVNQGPVDYAAVAGRLDPTYQQATDAFAKKDALAAVRAKLDLAIAQAKASPYVQLPPIMTRMPEYDVEHGKYDLTPLIGADRGMHVAEGAASVRYAASPALATYSPVDEATARRDEHTLATNPLPRQILLTVYGKVVSATLMSGEPQLTVVPSRVVIENTYVDGHTSALLTATVP